MTTALENDHHLAGRLATAAGEVLLALRADLTSRRAPDWRVMDEGDAASHHFLVRALRDERPHDAILSEEGRDSAARLSAARVWIIDPLDGTNEFGEPGRTDWAVHVALVEHGRPTAAGLHVSRIDGSPLVYNRPHPWLPDLLVCRRELAAPALEALWG